MWEAGAHNLSLPCVNTGFISFRLLWFQRLICSDIGGLYLQFLMANRTPDSSSDVCSCTHAEGIGRAGDRRKTQPVSGPCLCGSIPCLCLRGQAARGEQESRPSARGGGSGDAASRPSRRLLYWALTHTPMTMLALAAAFAAWALDDGAAILPEGNFQKVLPHTPFFFNVL